MFFQNIFSCFIRYFKYKNMSYYVYIICFNCKIIINNIYKNKLLLNLKVKNEIITMCTSSVMLSFQLDLMYYETCFICALKKLIMHISLS